MSDEQGDITFHPVNLGQALNVLGDVVASYVTATVPASLNDHNKKVASQVAVKIFLHSLLMRSKHKTEMADLLDLISAELRDAAKTEPPPDPAGPASTDS